MSAEVLQLRRQVQQARQLAEDARRSSGGGAGPAGADGAPGLDAVLGTYASGSEPAAGAGNAGRFIVVTTAANPTVVQVCVVNSAGGYEWITVAATTCTITVARSGCVPVCMNSTAVSTWVRGTVSTTTLTCTFSTSGTNTCNCLCP